MYRKLFFDVEKALKNFRVVILLGLRKMGKTTILRQLSEKHNGRYVDFRSSLDPNKDFIDSFKGSEELILLDEVGYLPDFDMLLANLDQEAGRFNKRFVITSSCYGALKQLGLESLGAGRACILELFPLSFEEYLLFIGRIEAYNQEYTPNDVDVQNYYRLENVPPGMEFILNRDYLLGVYKDTEIATMNYHGAQRDITISEEQFVAVLDILAYSLNQQVPMKRFGSTKVAVQEFGAVKASSLELSSSLVQIANANANANINYSINHLKETITPREIGLITAYLLHTGFLFVDLIVTEADGETQSAEGIINALLNVDSKQDLSAILKEYTISVISPLLYTRLMIDLELIAEQSYDNTHLTGLLYELAIKSEDIKTKGFMTCHYSYKYRNNLDEVDLLSGSLLLEATVTHKENHNLLTAYPSHSLIRVLTDTYDITMAEVRKEQGYYRIAYPLALLMLSSGSIFNLERLNIL